jgi:hypothetical protein
LSARHVGMGARLLITSEAPDDGRDWYVSLKANL